jgi:hypothetical protein
LRPAEQRGAADDQRQQEGGRGRADVGPQWDEAAEQRGGDDQPDEGARHHGRAGFREAAHPRIFARS